MRYIDVDAAKAHPDEKCGSCRFFSPGDTTCRVRAPSGPDSRFPFTTATRWCGEFRGMGVTPSRAAETTPRAD